MVIFAVVILLLGLMVLFAGSVWFIVNAFRTSVLWGIAVFLFTPAWIRFAWCHWDLASRPLLLVGIGFLLTYSGGHMVPADAQGAMAQFAQPFAGGKADKVSKEKLKLPPMFAAQKEMELKLKLTALAERENDLRARKAVIDPRDQQAVNAIKEEIIKYNAELQPVLQEMRERGMQTAAR